MLAVSLTVTLAALASFSSTVLARDLPYNIPSHLKLKMIKRQGTFVSSTNASDFGTCTTPEIKGALGLDGRTEFAFEPTDLTSYPHASAQGIQIITQFICDTLVNTCAASTAAHNLCTATEAAVGSGKNDGSLADKFNTAFGLTTSFATAPGSVVGGVTVAGSAAASPTVATSATSIAAVEALTTASASSCLVATSSAAATSTSSAASATSSSTPAAVSSSSLDLGSCSNPEILFENGLDGRTQPAFIAANQADFNHGPALAIGVITAFIQQRLTSPCNAGADAIAAAASGITASVADGASTGDAADAWNAAFGITSDFASGATNARKA